MKTDLQIVYKYFSHNMRNSTALIAASVALLSHKMSNDEEQLFAEVNDAASLLDLFDRGMYICFQEIFEEYTDYDDILDLEQALTHFIEQHRAQLTERGIKLNLHTGSPVSIRGQVHEIRVLSAIIIYEMLMQAGKAVSIKLVKNKLNIKIDKMKEIPAIWAIFKTILAKRGVKFVYKDNCCTLEYLREYINS